MFCLLSLVNSGVCVRERERENVETRKQVQWNLLTADTNGTGQNVRALGVIVRTGCPLMSVEYSLFRMQNKETFMHQNLI